MVTAIDWSPIIDYVSGIYGNPIFTKPLVKEHNTRWVFEWPTLQLVIDQWKTRWDVMIFAKYPDRTLTMHRYDSEEPDLEDISRMLAALGVEERVMNAVPNDSVNRGDWRPSLELEIDIRREVTRELLRVGAFEDESHLLDNIITISKLILTGEIPSPVVQPDDSLDSY